MHKQLPCLPAFEHFYEAIASLIACRNQRRGANLQADLFCKIQANIRAHHHQGYGHDIDLIHSLNEMSLREYYENEKD